MVSTVLMGFVLACPMPSDYKLEAKGLGATLVGCPEHQISDTARL